MWRKARLPGVAAAVVVAVFINRLLLLRCVLLLHALAVWGPCVQEGGAIAEKSNIHAMILANLAAMWFAGEPKREKVLEREREQKEEMGCSLSRCYINLSRERERERERERHTHTDTHTQRERVLL